MQVRVLPSAQSFLANKIVLKRILNLFDLINISNLRNMCLDDGRPSRCMHMHKDCLQDDVHVHSPPKY